jgi:hypothetical protein
LKFRASLARRSSGSRFFSGSRAPIRQQQSEPLRFANFSLRVKPFAHLQTIGQNKRSGDGMLASTRCQQNDSPPDRIAVWQSRSGRPKFSLDGRDNGLEQDIKTGSRGKKTSGF